MLYVVLILKKIPYKQQNLAAILLQTFLVVSKAKPNLPFVSLPALFADFPIQYQASQPASQPASLADQPPSKTEMAVAFHLDFKTFLFC